MGFDAAARRVREEIAFWRLVVAHPATPRRAKWLAGAALAYLAFPVDLIPDFLPAIGHLDDVVVVGGLLYFAKRSIPSEVWNACREKAGANPRTASP